MTNHTASNVQLIDNARVAARRMYSDWENNGGPSPSHIDLVDQVLTSVGRGCSPFTSAKVADVVAAMAEWSASLNTQVTFILEAFGVIDDA